MFIVLHLLGVLIGIAIGTAFLFAVVAALAAIEDHRTRRTIRRTYPRIDSTNWEE